MRRGKGGTREAVVGEGGASPSPVPPRLTACSSRSLPDLVPGLVFLARSSTARKLAAAWTALPAEVELDEGEDEEEALERLWARRSGVAVEAVRAWAPVLLGNGLCLDGGRLAPAVLELLAPSVAASEGRPSR